MKHIITVFLIFMTGMAYGQNVTTRTITIDPYMTFQNYEHFKRLILSSPDSHIEYLENFSFQWGYRYKIRVVETEPEIRLSDGTRYTYELIRVISKTKVADTLQFTLFLDANRYYSESESDDQEMKYTLKQINDSTYLYFDAVVIEVPQFLSVEFSLIARGEIATRGTFVFVDDKRIRLLLLEKR
jgi:hypothetical protein